MGLREGRTGESRGPGAGGHQLLTTLPQGLPRTATCSLGCCHWNRGRGGGPGSLKANAQDRPAQNVEVFPLTSLLGAGWAPPPPPTPLHARCASGVRV